MCKCRLVPALKLAAFACILIVILTAVENYSQWYLATYRRLAWFAEHRPSAYEHSPYYSRDFIVEQSFATDSYTIDEYGDMVSDFHGTWYNFDQGHRRTVGQPILALHAIYLLGASTIASLEVPDQYTIASYLQALVGNQYKIINLGQGGYFANLELHRIRRLDLKPGDIVVFYDGVNDTIAYGRDAREQTWYGHICNWLEIHASRLYAGRLACRNADMSLPVLPDNSAIGQAYRSAIVTANNYAHSHGVQFYHFVQPILWSKALSAQEQAISNDPMLVDGVWRSAVLGGWTQMQAGHRDANVKGADLTHILDGIRDQDHAIYFDFDHINEVGNLMVAQAIYTTLFGPF